MNIGDKNSCVNQNKKKLIGRLLLLALLCHRIPFDAATTDADNEQANAYSSNGYDHYGDFSCNISKQNTTKDCTDLLTSNPLFSAFTFGVIVVFKSDDPIMLLPFQSVYGSTFTRYALPFATFSYFILKSGDPGS